MKKSKLIEYTFAIIFCIISFFNLFVPNATAQTIIICSTLIIGFIIANKFIKMKKIDSVNKGKVIQLLIFLAIIYIAILYVLGLFVGFYKNPNGRFGLKLILKKILPYIIIVVFSEFIRQIFIPRNNKKTTIIITTALVFTEMTAFINSYNFKNLNGALALVGYIFIPAISINLYSNYIIKRYSYLPNIIYRLIITLYMYFFSILPDIYMFFQSVFKFVYPYIVYIVIDRLYERGNFKKTLRDKKLSIISLVICSIIILSLIMLISCKFKYGIIVTGSSSMSKNINKGDAVVFEQYRGQELQKDQVIIFYKGDIKTIHRIQKVQEKNGQLICYTKGDANPQADEGYRTVNDIIGIAKFRIIYIGWPTLWLNDMLNRTNK